MPPRTKEMARHVEVVLKALDLFDCFQHKPALTLKEMVDLTGMTRGRATRLAGTLECRGYLIYDPEHRQFRLGPRLLTLGKVFETHNTMIFLARPILKDLVRMTGEVASLYVMDGAERVALAREKGTHEVSFSVAEGQRMQLYAGAAGKVLLAFAPPDVRNRVMARESLQKLTSRTITNPKNLAQELDLTRSRGYAVSDGERVADVWSAAAPVFDHTQAVCAAIGVTGPSYRIPHRVQSKYIAKVVEKARELSLRLGWKASSS
jgi:DNA-binding IclR family transcriptional regulator